MLAEAAMLEIKDRVGRGALLGNPSEMRDIFAFHAVCTTVKLPALNLEVYRSDVVRSSRIFAVSMQVSSKRYVENDNGSRINSEIVSPELACLKDPNENQMRE